ncbi:hypothetical protein [Amycolatopsis australiensis]|uniref:hypothetical protein n=1 Tax=Amycolatopsis australiensis TaxID=546364 RepID=UPI0015A5BD9E|nr:hypothetical protein [Amycolatopsis australiensis]
MAGRDVLQQIRRRAAVGVPLGEAQCPRHPQQVREETAVDPPIIPFLRGSPGHDW